MLLLFLGESGHRKHFGPRYKSGPYFAAGLLWSRLDPRQCPSFAATHDPSLKPLRFDPDPLRVDPDPLKVDPDTLRVDPDPQD